jgi:CubicO group peptidase (beta-lactamase class C family)
LIKANSLVSPVLVMQEDQVFYAQGFGYADLEGRKKIDTRALFRLGSISKQFTTMAIMQLAAAGHLEYDDLLSEHIPELAHWPHIHYSPAYESHLWCDGLLRGSLLH